MIKNYHRWGKSPLPQRWKQGHSIGRMLTPVVIGAASSSEDLQVLFARGSTQGERLEHFAPSKGELEFPALTDGE
jgi:hypothetical protein